MKQNSIQEALFLEHIKELRKYTLGELLTAIDEDHTVSLRPVGRAELVWYPTKERKRSPCGGPAIVLVFREGNVTDEDFESIQKLFPETKWGI